MKTLAISDEARRFAATISEHRHTSGYIFQAHELTPLFSSREQETLLSPDEAALILSVIADRQMTSDYIKRLRLDHRLAGKKISDRAFVYRLRDLFFVDFRKPYKRKPTGRPKKISDKSKTA